METWEEEVQAYRRRTKKSARAWEAAKRRIPSGVNSNYRLVDPYPLYVRRARGSRIWDADENEYVDFNMGFGALVAAGSVLAVIGNNAWIAWMGDLVPGPVRGRFFGRRTVYLTLAGAASSLGVGLVLDALTLRGWKNETLAGLAAVAIKGQTEALAVLFDKGIPSMDPMRAPIALALGTVALRNTPLMLSTLEARKDLGEAIDLLSEGFDAIFVGSGAPRGRDLDIPGRKEAAANIHIGIDWLSSVSFGHTDKIGRRVIVLGGGNTAMDCCRTSRRLGGDDVKVIVRSGFEEMKASPWEKEDAQHEGIPILNFLVPKEFVIKDGKLAGMKFEKVKAVYDEKKRRSLVPTGEPDQFFECDDVLVAVGQENAFPWIERDAGIEFDKYGLPVLNARTFQSTVPNVLFGGDSAFGPKNIIWAVAHGHDAAVSIDKLLNGEDIRERPAPGVSLMSQKMGIHEWSYDNDIAPDVRYKVPWRDIKETLKNVKAEVELGFDVATAWKEAQRCLNCDVQTVFTEKLCIECDACVDICPMDCISFTHNDEERTLRKKLTQYRTT